MNAPLFLLGAPQSGTSLLYRALALHPRAAWISNYHRRLSVLPEVAVLNRLAPRAPEARRRSWFGEEGELAHDRRRGLLVRSFPYPVEGEPVFRRRGLGPGADDVARKPDPLLLRADLARLTRAAGGRTLVSKRAAHNRWAGLLAEVFPEGRFVVMSRDGRDVARSLVARPGWLDSVIWWYGATPRAWVAAGGDPLELAALHWVHEVEAIEQGLARVPNRRILRVSYEALVRSPADVLAGTAVWCGLGDDPCWHEELARIRFPDRNVLATVIADHRIGAIQAAALRALGDRA